MAETHLWMFVASLVVSFWWTKQWLIDNIFVKWRYLFASFVSVILWVYVAYSSTRVVEASSGVQVVFGSTALAYVAVFMAFMSFMGMILGWFLWTEEEAERASEQMPDEIR